MLITQPTSSCHTLKFRSHLHQAYGAEGRRPGTLMTQTEQGEASLRGPVPAETSRERTRGAPCQEGKSRMRLRSSGERLQTDSMLSLFHD